MKEYNDEIQIKDILIKFLEYKSFLLKNKITIITFSFFFLTIGVFYNVISDKKYNAELTFVVESEPGGNSLGVMSGVASQMGFDFSGNNSSTFSQSNIIELLKSRGVISNTLMQLGKVDSKSDLLIEHYLTINKTRKDWTNINHLQALSFHNSSTYTHDSISGVIWKNIIENNLTIELTSNDANLITLSFTSSNQEFAKEFVEILIDQMSKMYISHQTAMANNTLDFLKDRSDSVFLELEIAEQEFAKVKDINQRIIKATGRLRELQLMRKVEVLNTMYLEIVKNLELSKITLLDKTPIINIIDEPILPLQDHKMSTILAGLLSGFLGFFSSFIYFIFRKLFLDALAES
jgi:uncharacterized protein involved in exopolysaccharide biosynthesis